MRLWSIHPKHLDTKGLLAVWREGLLAKNVLEGKTKGYKNHPQLDRFKAQSEPLKSINKYLYYIWIEARSRGYNFDSTKINVFEVDDIMVTSEQIEYEKQLLNFKLKQRQQNYSLDKVELHPIFNIINGPIEKWEKIRTDIFQGTKNYKY